MSATSKAAAAAIKSRDRFIDVHHSQLEDFFSECAVCAECSINSLSFDKEFHVGDLAIQQWKCSHCQKTSQMTARGC